ncbi:hypothetical protein [Streptomyces sp. NPDC058247]
MGVGEQFGGEQLGVVTEVGEAVRVEDDAEGGPGDAGGAGVVGSCRA